MILFSPKNHTSVGLKLSTIINSGKIAVYVSAF